MAAVIPEQYLDLFEKKTFAYLATLMPDGSPQVTPVWVDFDGAHILVNSARGRQKDKNMRHNRAVSLVLSDPKNPYRYLEVRGQVAAITEEGAGEHIDRMAKKYLGVDKYPHLAVNEVRVLYRVEPLHVTFMG